MGITRGIINAINGASISPSSISNLWNGTNVTADVNNSATTTEDLDIAGNDLAASGDFLSIGPSDAIETDRTVSTTSTSYVGTNLRMIYTWDTVITSGGQGAIAAWFIIITSVGDLRLVNNVDGETIDTATDASTGTRTQLGPTNYTPTTTGSPITTEMQFRTNDGGTATEITEAMLQVGVQV